MAYGVVLTVVPELWTPFTARFTVPNVGWAGVFTVAIVMDVSAALLAFFVLRRMSLPGSGEPVTSYLPAQVTPAIAGGAE